MNEAGVAYVPADRHRFGLITPFTLADNLVLTSYYRRPYARGLLRDGDAIARDAATAIERFDIRTPSASVTAGTLSGGNQQKAVVAREFDRDLKLLVLDQPTRGLDVGSIEFIHRQVIAKRDAGTAVLLVSAELDEVLEMSDRIGVMYRGKIVAVLDGTDCRQERGGPPHGHRRRRAPRGTHRGRPMSASAAPAAGERAPPGQHDLADLVGRGRSRRRDRAVGAPRRRDHRLLRAARPGSHVRPRAAPGGLLGARERRVRQPGCRRLHARLLDAARVRRPGRRASASRPACSTSAPRGSSSSARWAR